MGWDGGGSITWPYDWTDDRDAGGAAAIISATKFDAQWADAASAIEACLNRNGENAIAANIDWGGYRILNVGDPTEAGHGLNASSVAENTVQYGGTTAGSSNTYTLSQTFLATVGTGTRLLCLANHSNTGAATLNVNSGGAVAIVLADGSTALAGGEIVSGDFFEVAYDGTSWCLINSPSAGAGLFTDGSVQVGVADSVPGGIAVYGGGTGEAGGYIDLYNNFDDDGTIDFWRMTAEDGSGNFVIQSNDGAFQTELFIATDGSVTLSPNNGGVAIGTSDSVPGILSITGGGTGEQGGELRLYNNADDDGTVDWWGIEAEDGTGDFAITAAGTTVFAIDAVAQSVGGDWVAALNPGGRLTHTTGTPRSTASASGTTIYYTPYTSDLIPLYDGSRWNVHSFSQLTNDLTDATDNPAAVTTNSNYDLFVWNDGGTLKLGRGPAWTNDTTRSLALSTVDNKVTNNSAITNGPGANEGLYVGTLRTNGSSQLEHRLFAGDSTVQASCLYWNMYNRERVSLYRNCKNGVSNTHTYHSTTVRQIDGANYQQCGIVLGYGSATATTQYATTVEQGAAATDATRAQIGSNVDVTNSFSGLSEYTQTFSGVNGDATNTMKQRGAGGANHEISTGYHFIALLEQHGDGASGAYTMFKADTSLTVHWEY